MSLRKPKSLIELWFRFSSSLYVLIKRKSHDALQNFVYQLLEDLPVEAWNLASEDGPVYSRAGDFAALGSQGSASEVPTSPTTSNSHRSLSPTSSASTAHGSKNYVAQFNEIATQRRSKVDWQWEAEGPPHARTWRGTILCASLNAVCYLV